jgi:hypothetical protein
MMNAYEIMVKTNHHIIKGGDLTDAQKANIVRQLLSTRSDECTKQSFYKGVNYQNNTDDSGDVTGTYPSYYIPPYNGGKKLQTIIPMSPKTHIFSANSYELEIIRLLCLFAPDDPAVKDMTAKTLKRLSTACFGNECIVGECFHSSLLVLRFIAAAAPDNTIWINKLVDKIGKNIGEKLKGKNRVHGNLQWYYWLCLSELAYDTAEPELVRYKEEIYSRLTKSAVMNSESDKIHQPVLLCILKNCLCRFPEYVYLKDRQPYVSQKDGRLHFDM